MNEPKKIKKNSVAVAVAAVAVATVAVAAIDLPSRSGVKYFQ